MGSVSLLLCTIVLWIAWLVQAICSIRSRFVDVLKMPALKTEAVHSHQTPKSVWTEPVQRLATVVVIASAALVGVSELVLGAACCAVA